jgi:transposase InsO family protein
MKEWHNHYEAGHLGRDETTRQIQEHYFWPQARGWIDQYIKGCATCQQNKNLTHRIKTLLYKITVPPNAPPFTQIAMDLITGLPKSRGFDSILTIVDHGCSHGAIFLPCHKTITGPQIAQLYYRHVYPWYGLPTRLISDRDPRFTSHFGKGLAKELGITWNLSTAFHPQTDGLTERKNQWVEQYLRLVIKGQTDWSNALPVATLVHNNLANATTRLPPNRLLIGREPPAIPQQATGSENPLAKQRVQQLRNDRQRAIEALNKVANNRKPDQTRWTAGQRVWLDAENLPLLYGSTKLTPRRYGPFEIDEVISPVVYKLCLPPQWNIHPTFYASLLTPYVETIEHGANYTRPPPDLVKGEEQYKVEAVRNHRRHGRRKQLQYLVKWKGYPESDNTWEPVGHL